MPTTVYNVLDQLRDSALSKVDQGTRFERLMKAFLTTDPVYADQFSEVWLWSEWPGNGGKHDTGIDLVARDRVTDQYVAIQCKFYAPTSTISKDDIDTFLSESGKEGFVERILVSTTDKWNLHAENAIKNQQVPVRRIGMSDLEASPVDWEQFSIETPEVLVTRGRKSPKLHQVDAIAAATAKFGEHDRGKLIMACGTGKTFTSLRLAEQMVGPGGSVLFLVPSISLLSQTLREWAVESETRLHPLAVCSDRKSTKRSANADVEDIATVDLALPATTNIPILAERLRQAKRDSSSMTVVFSTYQSIDVVAKAQREAGLEPFDLIICDEAHRTTGVTLADEDESPFVRVHDDTYIQGEKRLYMTATPRIYDDATKTKAGEAAAVLASMDNEETFGPEFYRLGFGDAVAKGLLTDYKVLVLAVDGKTVASTFQAQLADGSGELQLDDVAKIVGCWNGLAKKGHIEHNFDADLEPMRRAVAFAGTIKASKKVEGMFSNLVDQYVAVHETDDDGEPVNVLDCEVRHVDGTFNALERNTRLDWLRAEVPDGQCRILTNARCLSEGVDVPGLDAVMFMAPRKSVVDVVQSVGRVMRLSPGKKFGYIILPIAIPEGIEPEVALRDNARYRVVWEVLQALRAHDDRFNAEVNKIDLTKHRSDRINVIGVGGGSGAGTSGGTQLALPLDLRQLDEWRDAIYTRIVQKVGSRRYWQDWAKNVAQIAENHITRITALLESNQGQVSVAFDKFLSGLRANLNEGITRSDAIEMLAQHLITRPVFDALFGSYDFTQQNPIAMIMEQMLAILDEQSLDTENSELEDFYNSVRMRVDGIDTADGRQKIIVELYETFFMTAFKRTVNKLGIVYTPVEVVDFLLRSADEVLRSEFGQGLTDEGVHILDGFSGTGTFMVRLLQSGLITAADLPRKYAQELHANEILLLAYYIAAVNIESAYHDHADKQSGDYEPFPGLVLTDTFQSWEEGDRLDDEMFRDNNARLERLKKLPITVIVGNPPYRGGQETANDANANESYPALDESIRSTYAARSTAKLKNKLYDPYVRAIRWASLRIPDRGVIAYVTNGGWLESNQFDGMRKTLINEFSTIYVYNLRGNARRSGEDRRKEAGNVFGGGSRATVAITILVKDPAKTGPATIHYAEVGDGLTREQKLGLVGSAESVAGVDFSIITPNEHGDWINHRRDDFTAYPALDKTFGSVTHGVNTGRDAWVYQSSRTSLEDSLGVCIGTFNKEVGRWSASPAAGTSDAALTAWADRDSTRISWSSNLLQAIRRGKKTSFLSENVRVGAYRPFFKQWMYFDPLWNSRMGGNRELFPTPQLSNMILYTVGMSSAVPFSILITDEIPNLHLTGAGSGGAVFARYRYEPVEGNGAFSFEMDGEIVGGYRKIDNITDQLLAKFQGVSGDQISKDDIFFYVYGLLHSPDYRDAYAADLTKMLPRIPLVSDPWPFVKAGRALSELHLGYESVERFPLVGLSVEPSGDPYEFFRVEKMAFRKHRVDGKLSADKTAIVFNSKIMLTGIPEDAYRYMIGARSAVEWIIDRYRVKTDKVSGIVNDPNDWSKEVDEPRYILDLLARIVTVSIETMAIVDALPELDILAVADMVHTP
ncbi:DEAD/DEAH box helicase [Arthrobacter sp. Soil763]|uniref:DEAD/DEAH box helicase n=1 Tax=Arthrobacter sp. Soil763 TaxID=1736402 RepID=UPI0006F488B5|nr:type ISP restriction/modification enzyme [Arthrobacter sp. Soil763]KRE76610.1 damage-inducible protein [Arthrobacter sp. Soil763]